MRPSRSTWVEHGWLWSLVIAFIAPLAAGGLTAYEVRDLLRANDDLDAQRTVVRRLENLMSTLKDAETGQRGYLLTADPSYLKPYRDALAALPGEISVLGDSMTLARPEKQASLVEMNRLVEEKQAELRQTTAMVDQGQRVAALAIVRGGSGKRAMDTIRRLAADIRQQADLEIVARTNERRALEMRSAYGLGFALATAVLLIVLLWRAQLRVTRSRARLHREMEVRAEAEQARRRAWQGEVDARQLADAEARRRQTVEDSLSDSDQGLAITLASIGAGFMATDREGRVTRMNAVAERLTGWTQADALGRILWDVFDREDRPARFLTMNPVDVMLEEQTTVDEVHHIAVSSRQGERATLEVRAALTHWRGGAVHGLVLIFRDLTLQLRLEAEASRLAAIVESSYDAIVGKTLDGTITNWNSAAQTLFGYSALEAMGQPVQMLMPQDRQHEEMRILADLARGVRVSPFDTVRRAKDGSLLAVSVTISPIRDARGRVVGASKIARDVTQQRRAEAALRDSEARLRLTLDAAQIGDWDLDLRTGGIRRSLRHDRCFGYETPQAEWSIERFAEHVHPQDRAGAMARLKIAIAERTELRLECRVVWPDSSIHWINISASIPQREGDSSHMFGIVRDITEQMSAEDSRRKLEQLEAENRQIQEATRLKSQFLANMSHELRTPLNAIIGFADLLHSGAVAQDSLKHQLFLGHIATSGRHLLQLINDVLDLSKVESGKFEFFPEPVDLAALVKEVSDILQTPMSQKALHYAADIDATLTDLCVDPARLKQALYNYLSNAIKFTPEMGRVAVRATPQGPDHWRIEVQDTGIGIPPAQIRHLFSEFHQIDAGYGKQHQGTGLGLALTKRQVDAQGGFVGVASTPGEGSIFHAVFQRVHGAAVAPPPLALAPGQEHFGAHLLVVEDDRDVRARILIGLAGSGFAISGVATGTQAEDAAAQTFFDALTLDLHLPDQDSLGLLARLRSQDPGLDSPVIGLTASSSAGMVASFAIADILAKPIRVDEVARAMGRVGEGSPGPVRVMVIDDSQADRDLMRATLAAVGIEAVCFDNGADAVRAFESVSPAAVVLDLMMPALDGFAVLSLLQRLPSAQQTPIYVWTGLTLTEDEYRQLALSAGDIVAKGGADLGEMIDRLRQWRPQSTAPAD